jgi:hypothetical protein
LKRTERLKDNNLQPVSTGFGYEPCDFSPRQIMNGASPMGKLIVGNHLTAVTVRNGTVSNTTQFRTRVCILIFN